MKFGKFIIILVAFVLLIAVIVLMTLNNTEVKTEMMAQYSEKSINDIPQEKWDRLANKNIFFAHMSVGNNIMEGVEGLLKQNPHLTLKICRIEDIETTANQGFCHSLLGNNTLPLEKIKSFKSQIQKLKVSPDIAFLKFCYVDIQASTDVNKVFGAYREMVAELETAFPNTIFMHCTVPLTSGPVSFKRSVKEVLKPFLGKTTELDDNSKRLEFNTLLKQTYKPETIIDIAHFESTTSEGKFCFKSKNSTQVPFMIKAYTNDGGHLNEAGRKRVAEQLLIRLATVIDQEPIRITPDKLPNESF